MRMKVPEDNADLDENSPIIQAIDFGGGQSCDIAGVIRELDAAGFTIVSVATVLRWRGALAKIRDIEDQMVGGDWDEIEEARAIATDALSA